MIQILKKLKTKYNSQKYLHTDPLSIVYRYNSPQDRELSALIVALYSYGSVTAILRFLDRFLYLLGKSPYAFFMSGEDPVSQFQGRLGPYRFQTESDSLEFLRVLGVLVRKNAQKFPLLESYFLGEFEKTHSIKELQEGAGILSFQRMIRKELCQQTYGLDFLLGKEVFYSPHKRYSLFLRWMVGNEYPDLGLYSNYPKEALVFPIDTHIRNIMKILGFLETTSVSRKTAIDFTKSLSRILGENAVSYDFALSRIGILKQCKGRFEADLCPACEIRSLCKFYSQHALGNRGFSSRSNQPLHKQG